MLSDDERKLVEDHIYIAEKIARRVRNAHFEFSRDDCYSFLLLRLCHAAIRYDASKGMSFADYAWYRLLYALQEFLRTPYKRRLTDEYRQTVLFESERAPDDYQYTAFTGYTRQSTLELLTHEDSYESLHLWDLLRRVDGERNRFILFYSLVLGYTDEAIAEILDVSNTRVFKLRTRAQYRLLHPALPEPNSN